MSTNIKVIKFTLKLSSFFLLVTFAICLNINYEWFNIKWLSNEFLLTIFSGVFASMLVVLVCEIQKYYLSKMQAEDKLFECTTEMLARFISTKTLLSNFAKNSDQLLSAELLKPAREHIKYQINIYLSIDYTPWRKKNELFLERIQFTDFLLKTMHETLLDCGYLDIAILEAQTQNLQTGIPQHHVTANNEIVFKVIQQLEKEFQVCIDALLSFMKYVDYSGRYSFQKRLPTVQRIQENFEDFTLEDFLNKEV